jgi:hypothetical protein
LTLPRVASGLRPINKQEDALSRRTYGILAGVIGVGAWWWSRQRATSIGTRAVDRGTVIFHNTPEPSPLSSGGVI